MLQENTPPLHLTFTHLIRAIAAPPVEKIRLVAEAALMVPEPNYDRDTLDIIFKISIGFTNTEIDIHNQEFWTGVIPWPFEVNEPEYFNKYIKPWFGDAWLIVYGEPRSAKGLNAYSEGKAKNKEIQELRRTQHDTDKCKYFNICAREYTFGLATFEQLRSLFMAWAMPQTMQIFHMLSWLISPDV